MRLVYTEISPGHIGTTLYKENLLYKTNYNSYTVEDKQTKLGV